MCEKACNAALRAAKKTAKHFTLDGSIHADGRTRTDMDFSTTPSR